ncbi:HYR domain-containing protein, partial [Patiriisocius marinus]|uniref:HYR domain-containing protein n=1 Tax=Patiriisocius marinus TaxID=1397112 RepID=UPI00232DAA34
MKTVKLLTFIILGVFQAYAQGPTITGPGNININCGGNPVTFTVTVTDDNTTYPIAGPFGFTLIDAVDEKTYFLSDTYRSGINSINNADANGGKIATVKNAAMNALFRNASDGDSAIMIGLNDATTEGTFVWDNGDPLTYTNWASGQPDAAFPDEDYVRIKTIDGTWEDYRGPIPHRYVFELPGSFKQIAGLPSGSVFPPGTTTNTWVAYDIDGNMDTYSFDVTVAAETVAPVISCPTDETLVCGDPAFEYEVMATDNCTTFPIPAPAGFTALGSINGKSYFQSNTNYSAADAFIDAATRGGAVATIVDADTNTFIRDAKSGVVLIGYNDVATEGTFVWQSGDAAAYTNWAAGEPDASTDKDYTQMDVLGEWNTLAGIDYTSYILEITGGIEQTAGLPSGAGFPPGITTNTFLVTDLSGNTATCSFTVTGPADTTPPTIDTCPSNIIVNNEPGTCGAVVDYVAAASDDCTDFDGSLQGVLDNFNNNHATITAEIPNMHPFVEGVNGSSIEAANGSQLFAFGNALFPNGGPNILYQDGNPTPNSSFGTNGEYFTRKRPGMFLMAADLDGITTFNTNGLTLTDTPTDGIADGFTATITAGGKSYSIFVKRIHSAGTKPTINHIFIIPENAGVSQNITPPFGNGTMSDFHEITGLSTTTRMYYLLYSSVGGLFIDNATTETIAKTFIEQAVAPSQISPVAVTGLPSGSVFPVGTTTVTLEITDTAGNVNSPACTFDVIVNDVEPPIIVCDAELTTTLTPVTGSNMSAAGIPNPGVLSPSPTVTIAESAIIGPGSTLDSVEITIEHPNVEDLDIFLISPSGTSLELSTDNGGTGDNYTDTVFTDSAANITTGSAPFTGMFRPEGGTFAAAFAGEQINGDWTLSISDDMVMQAGTFREFIINFTAEVFDPADNTDEVFLDATGNITLDPADYDDRVSDNCDVSSLVITLSPDTFDCSDVGMTHAVTMTATDAAGNTSTSCDYMITVSDNLPPVITCPADQNETPDGMGMFTLPDYVTTLPITATDNCGATITYTQSPAAGTMIPVGTTSITVTASDGTNTVDCMFDVIVGTVTNTPPTITCPTDQTGDVNTMCMFSIPDYTGLATTFDADSDTVTVTQSPTIGSMVGVSTVVITLTADDGTTTTDCTFDVVVSDTTAPTIACPADQNEIADGTGMFTLPDYTTLATATDNCSVTSITQSPVAGTMVAIGTTEITLTASDGTNSMDCSFDVIVADNEDPVITCPADQTGDVDTACMFTIPDYTGLATATDNAGTPTVTQSPIPGTMVGTGTTIITLTASDGTNSADCTFNVVVSDTTAPTITCPADQNEIADGTGMFTLPDYTTLATATDNCSVTSITQSPVAGTIVAIGTTEITLTASDGTNSMDCSFDVIVADNEDPVITCPADQTGDVDTACMFTIPDYTTLATATDNSGTPTVTQSPIPGTMVGTGTTIITLTAS